MSFGEHLEELRTRLILAIVGLVPVFTVAVAFGDKLLGWLLLPAEKELRDRGLPAVLQATSPTETFGAYIKVATVITLLIGAPWALWQLWKFVAPGLYASERRFAYLLAPLSVGLTLLGSAFLYFVMLPVILAFFIGFTSNISETGVETRPAEPTIVLPTLPVLDHDPADAPIGSMWINTKLQEMRVVVSDGEGERVVLATPLARHATIVQQFRVSEYVGLVFSLGVSFAAGFQTPVVVLLLAWAGIIEPAFMSKHRKWVVLIVAVAAAVLTPADPLSMVLLGIPLYVLYELGLLLCRVLPSENVSRGTWFRGWWDRVSGAAREPANAGDE